MPSQKSARVVARKTDQNRPVRTATRTYVKRAQDAIARGESEAATDSVQRAIKALDKASVKGVIHPNNAARRKSRLMARLNKLGG